jgi:hypothetical protein
MIAAHEQSVCSIRPRHGETYPVRLLKEYALHGLVVNPLLFAMIREADPVKNW